MIMRMNWAQIRLYRAMHYLNVILKARQLGFSTFIVLFILDMCLFNSNTSAGIVADTKDNASKIFKKIKYAYDHLPSFIKAMVPSTTDSKTQMSFSNGSTIDVSTSLRSGTYQILLVSEMGKISVKYPEKAREIVTGSFNAVAAGQMIFVESTAEGEGGHFHALCESAQKQKGKLTELDFKFFFFPWWQHPEYTFPFYQESTPQDDEYFDFLKKQKHIEINQEQKNWYLKKKNMILLSTDPMTQGDMRREYPSYPEEAFQSSIEGAVYKDEMAALRARHGVTMVPYDPTLPVRTSWDIGWDNYTSIWFVQFDGLRHRVIDFYENNRKHISHYWQICQAKGYVYEEHIGPHDLRHHSKETGKTLEQAANEIGLHFRVLPVMPIQHGLNAVRGLFPMMMFDEQKCDIGLQHISGYQFEWDDKLGKYKKDPLHDEHSDAADSLRYYALGFLHPVEQSYGGGKKTEDFDVYE